MHVNLGIILIPALRRPKVRHHSLAIYVLLRGITLLVRCGNGQEALAQALAVPLGAERRWWNGVEIER